VHRGGLRGKEDSNELSPEEKWVLKMIMEYDKEMGMESREGPFAKCKSPGPGIEEGGRAALFYPC
jgi:hypothetical protein